MEPFSWAKLIGGMALFFFGLSSARHGLQLAAGDRLRMIMAKVTTNRVLAVFLGALITLILQSSSATTVILVSLAQTQLITLSQAFGVVLGADIGTTFIVILLSFKKITEYSLLLVAFGVVLETVTKGRLLKYIGQVVFGFGMVFFGMDLMSEATSPLGDNPVFLKAFEFLADNPGLSFTLALIFTVIVQASAATIGMAIALAFAGVMTLPSAVPIVLGANMGTCATALLASLGGGIEGKRVALLHTIVKALGVTLAFPFIGRYASWLAGFETYIREVLPGLKTGVSGQIALTHLLFNVALAVFFLPFRGVFVRLVEVILPSKVSREEVFGPKYLDAAALETPALAFAQAKREIMRIARLTYDLFADSLVMFQRNVDIESEGRKIKAADDKIDVLEKAVRFYLAKISQKTLTEEQADTEIALLSISSEMEDIGDIISKEMLQLAKKKARKMRIFSEEGWEELKRLHKTVLNNFDLMISMLTQPHKDIAQKALEQDEYLSAIEEDLIQSHLTRLHEGYQESFETSSIHMDVLGCMRTINVKVTKIVRKAVELS